MKRMFKRLTQWIAGLSTHASSSLAIAAVTLFLLFDFTALALNVWLSLRIESQAVYINLAGRQRMLSQQMVKNLLEIDDAEQRGWEPGPIMAKLENNTRLFDS